VPGTTSATETKCAWHRAARNVPKVPGTNHMVDAEPRYMVVAGAEGPMI